MSPSKKSTPPDVIVPDAPPSEPPPERVIPQPATPAVAADNRPCYSIGVGFGSFKIVYQEVKPE